MFSLFLVGGAREGGKEKGGEGLIVFRDGRQKQQQNKTKIIKISQKTKKKQKIK